MLLQGAPNLRHVNLKLDLEEYPAAKIFLKLKGLKLLCELNINVPLSWYQLDDDNDETEFLESVDLAKEVFSELIELELHFTSFRAPRISLDVLGNACGSLSKLSLLGKELHEN